MAAASRALIHRSLRRTRDPNLTSNGLLSSTRFVAANPEKYQPPPSRPFSDSQKPSNVPRKHSQPDSQLSIQAGTADVRSILKSGSQLSAMTGQRVTRDLMQQMGLGNAWTMVERYAGSSAWKKKKLRKWEEEGFVGWVERFKSYRKEQKKKPHTPGTTSSSQTGNHGTDVSTVAKDKSTQGCEHGRTVSGVVAAPR